MKRLAVTLALLAVLAFTPAHAKDSAADAPAVTVTKAGSINSLKAPAEHFTGTVRFDSRFQRPDPARIGGVTVTFEPGARTDWHTHPLGQTLIVTSGAGFVQHWGGAVQEIKPGDTVWIPPGVKHWHGAQANVAMTHIAIYESLNGNGVDWLEKVSDEQYSGKASSK